MKRSCETCLWWPKTYFIDYCAYWRLCEEQDDG